MNTIDKEIQDRDEVLVGNNAQTIYQHIRDLENNISKHGRRWFWELLQNAKDVKKDNEDIEIEVEYSDNKLIFRHSGKAFRGKEVIHLIYHGSTKTEDESKIGKYGTGFMTTHLLSKKVEIKGKLFDEEKCFDFELDRNGESSDELKDTIEKSWEAYRRSKFDCNSINKFNTHFKYHISSTRQYIIKDAFADLKKTLPFVLATNQEIAKISITNNNEAFSISKETSIDIEPNYKEVKIKIGDDKYTVFKIEDEIPIEFDYLKEDDTINAKEIIKISLSIELKDNFIQSIEENIPRFYFEFPLFTTEEFKFPAIVNSLSFAPKTERDGVYLGNSNTYDVKKNKAVLSEAFKLYLKLVDKLIDHNCFNTHFLADIVNLNLPEIDNDWYNDEIKKIIPELIKKEIIRNKDNKLIKLSNSIIPFSIQSEYQNELWELVERIYPDRIVLEDLYDDWINILIKWKDFGFEKFNFEITLKDIANLIAEEVDIKGFSLKYFNEKQDDAFAWLNRFYKLLNDNNTNFIIDEIAIIPNQTGMFIKKTSEIKLDKDIDNRLKDILKLLDENIREVLIDSQITFYNSKSIFSNKTQQEVYEHTINKVKSIENYFTDKEFSASKEMLDWLLKNDKIEQLEGFPVSVSLIEEKRNIYKLSSAHRLLACVNLWKSCFNNYAEIFNPEFILNDEYEPILKDYIIVLEDKGYIYSQPLYKEKHKFNKDDVLKVITEKIEEDFWTEDDENETVNNISEITVSKIAYFVTPSDKSVLRNSRKSKKQTQNLLEFIFNCILDNDDLIFDEKKIIVNEKEVSIYPSFWLAKLKSNQWVNIGKDKDEAPNSSNLSWYFERSEQLKLKLKDEKVAKLLNIIGVSVGDLTKNIYVKTDKERLEWDKAYTSILSAGYSNDVKPEEIQNIFNDAFLIDEIKRKFKEKNIVKTNRNIGLTVEKIFQSIINDELEELDIKITKVEIGRDFDIEFDFVDEACEKVLLLENKNYKYSIELKSTRTDYIRMTKAQGLLSTQKEDDFTLCVLQHNYNIDDFNDENGNIKEEVKAAIKSKIRFVTTIGSKLTNQVLKVNELESKVAETRMKSDEIEVDIDDGEIKYKVNENAWIDTMTITNFIEYLKGKFKQ